MLAVLFLFNIVYLVKSELLTHCELINTQQQCLDNIFCAWCNSTNVINNTVVYDSSCIFKNSCSNKFNNTNCITSNINYTCSIMELIINFIIISVFCVCAYTILYSMKNIVNEPIYNKYTVYINLLVFAIIFIPSILLWYLQPDYFIPYILVLIVVSLGLCCVSSSSKYRRNRHHEYNIIN